MQTPEPGIPYGMRFLAPARVTAQDTTGVTYDPELQIAVGADGNPWTTLVGADTSSTTNNDSRDDEGTDVW
jgi:putative ATP-grasp target RiPP